MFFDMVFGFYSSRGSPFVPKKKSFMHVEKVPKCAKRGHKSLSWWGQTEKRVKDRKRERSRVREREHDRARTSERQVTSLL